MWSILKIIELLYNLIYFRVYQTLVQCIYNTATKIIINV